MKPRLPRRHKKKVKKILSALSALRVAQCAMVAAQSRIQIAMVAASPRSMDTDINSHRISMASALIEITKDAHNAIANVISQKPNHWRDYLK